VGMPSIADDVAADSILHGLLVAQATWLATRDRSALRRELLALLVAIE